MLGIKLVIRLTKADPIRQYALFAPTHGHYGRTGQRRPYHKYIGRPVNCDNPPTATEIAAAAVDKKG